MQLLKVCERRIIWAVDDCWGSFRIKCGSEPITTSYFAEENRRQRCIKRLKDRAHLQSARMAANILLVGGLIGSEAWLKLRGRSLTEEPVHNVSNDWCNRAADTADRVFVDFNIWVDIREYDASYNRLFMAALCNRGAIIFLPCNFFPSSFFMVALCNRETIYIFIL